MEREFKNYKTFEEAQEIWNKNVASLKSDDVIFYILPNEPKDSLIGIENADEYEKFDVRFKILAVGEEVKDYKSGDVVALHPASPGRSYPIFIEDCLFTSLGYKSITLIFK